MGVRELHTFHESVHVVVVRGIHRNDAGILERNNRCLLRGSERLRYSKKTGKLGDLFEKKKNWESGEMEREGEFFVIIVIKTERGKNDFHRKNMIVRKVSCTHTAN